VKLIEGREIIARKSIDVLARLGKALENSIRYVERAVVRVDGFNVVRHAHSLV
jgi:hypothetical protein